MDVMEVITQNIIEQVTSKTIKLVMTCYPLSEEAEPLLTPELSIQDAVTILTEQASERDAIQLLAHALPIMKSIRWGHTVLSTKQWTKEEQQILDAVDAWLISPNETLRIRCKQLAERVGLEKSPAWLGYAIFWSGTGSIVDPDLPVVMPPDNMVGHAVNAAILIYLTC